MEQTWFYVIKKKEFLKITKEFPEYTIFLRERAILRRAHLLKIQTELYNDYTNRMKNKVTNEFFEDPFKDNVEQINYSNFLKSPSRLLTFKQSYDPFEEEDEVNDLLRIKTTKLRFGQK